MNIGHSSRFLGAKRSLTLLAAGSVVGTMALMACGSSTTAGTGASTSSSTTTTSTSGTTSSSSTTTSGSTSSSSGTGGGATGPGATLLCTSSGKNAYETYGTNAFVAVNKAIFANTNAEITANGTANLGNSFNEIGQGDAGTATADDLATFEGKLAAFLVWAYGGPTSITYTDNKTYVGDTIDLKTAHTGLGITSSQYTYFVTNIIVPALTSSGVSSADVSSCFAPLVQNTAVSSQIIGQ